MFASEGLLALGDLDDPLDVKMTTVGRNVTPESHYKVIDEDGNDLPVNREGELVASGPEVFTGYYKTTAEENRAVFTPDGYYRTGDLAKIDERGYITITGRKKDVIQRGGETLVPGEMENHGGVGSGCQSMDGPLVIGEDPYGQGNRTPCHGAGPV